VTVATPARGKLSPAEREAIIDRVIDGATMRAVGEAFGISHERVRQIVMYERRVRRRAAAEEVARDLDAAALRLRWRTALELVGSLKPAEREELLAAVVWPSPELLEASRERAAAGVDELVASRPCVGCGTDRRNYTDGCRTCQDRKDGRAKRARQLASRSGLYAESTNGTEAAR